MIRQWCRAPSDNNSAARTAIRNILLSISNFQMATSKTFVLKIQPLQPSATSIGEVNEKNSNLLLKNLYYMYFDIWKEYCVTTKYY